MSNIDYLSLDGRTLRTFIAVLEEQSVSAASERLGVTQSAVSHTLDKLRLALGDPLFVRSGRGIMPTERARELRLPIQSVLDGMKSLTDQRVFDPALEQMSFTIAANDFQRNLLFPQLMRKLRSSKTDCTLDFLSSGVPAAKLLREAHCQLVISPFPPTGNDIIECDLFTDRLMCFYDEKSRKAPANKEEFFASDYIDVRFQDYASALFASMPKQRAALKRPTITVPGFSDVAVFIFGSSLICSAASLMRHGPFRGLALAPLPFDSPPLKMKMAWHMRDHTDPAHMWLRDQIRRIAKNLAPA